MKKPRTYKQLRNDPRVSDWSDERSMGACNDGLWIYLAPGWVTWGECLLTIHEWTVAECCDDVALAVYSPEDWVDAAQFNGSPSLLPAG
jgi:hypothetical protein